MKKINQFIILLSMFMILRSPIIAAPGETGLSFLTFGNGARAMGMAEAQGGLAEGVNAIAWNPAGLALAESPEVLFTHQSHFEDSSYQYGALAVPFKNKKFGAVGFSFTGFGVKEIESRDAQSSLLGNVEQKDKSLQLSWGAHVLGQSEGNNRTGLFIGAGVKHITEELAGVSADGFGWDLGMQYRPGEKLAESMGSWVERTSIGLSGHNIGPGIKFDSENTDLPTVTRLGLGYTHFIFGDALNIGLDYRIPKNEDAQLAAGVEFWLKNHVAFRFGYLDEQDIGEGIRAGAGFRFKLIQIDYAWAGYTDRLGDTHRISLEFRFGKNAQSYRDGLKEDLIQYNLLEAEKALDGEIYHEAVLRANEVLLIDPKNTEALQILHRAAVLLKKPGPLPAPENNKEIKVDEMKVLERDK